jgi:plastocyanin
MKLNRLSIYAALLLTFSVVACGGKEDEFDDIDEDGDENGAATTAAPAVDPATAATITGVVNFEGTAPAPTPVKMESDPVCNAATADAKPESTQEVVVTDGKLGNVFVYVSGGMEGKTFPPPSETAEIDQQGCRYHPHVIGVMVGQPLKIKNNDATLHNVHGTPAKNKQFNIAQATQGKENEVTFDQEEVMIPVSCDVHGWMRSYVGVLPHPFFATSGTDGAFSIKGLPPGDYTLTAWHEKLGKQEQKVTVGAKETKNISFSFK